MTRFRSTLNQPSQCQQEDLREAPAVIYPSLDRSDHINPTEEIMVREQEAIQAYCREALKRSPR